MSLAARRTRVTALVARGFLFLADKLGRGLRWIFVEGRAPLVGMATVLGLVLWSEKTTAEAAAVTAVGALLLFGPAIVNAGRRVMVGDFGDVAVVPAGEKASPPIGLGNLLQTELARLGSLFRVVEDRRAVSSGLVASAALDATISVDEVVSALQDTVSAETKVQVGPVSVPVAPFMALASRAFRAPRLTGTLHRDAGMLILTARQRGHSGLSWRVLRNLKAPSPEKAGSEQDVNGGAPEAVHVSGMVRELALRIFTDLALGRDVRWEASKHFVNGLELFRAALRTPRDRKVNLRKVEEQFLTALSEDEDFPVAYYNLGVVYSELHGLAIAGGRLQEARMHLNAAETSFKWAIEKEPRRSDTYLALAQTQFGAGRSEEAVAQCDHVLTMLHRWHLSARARAYDLRARSIVRQAMSTDGSVEGRDSTTRELMDGLGSARRSTHAAVWALIGARLIRRVSSGGEGDREGRRVELVGACAGTYALCYSRLMPTGAAKPVADGARALFRLSDSLLGSIPDFQFEFGLRSLARGDPKLAMQSLDDATQSDPKRSAYMAGRALILAEQIRSGGEDPHESGLAEIESLCDSAVEGMAGVFAPSRDMEACELVIKVYETLLQAVPAAGTAGVVRTRRKQRQSWTVKAAQLRAVADQVSKRLDNPTSEASVSSFFLEALHDVKPKWEGTLGDYGRATRTAMRLLKEDDARMALEHAERATSLNPLSSLAWETLGDVHSELRDFRSARSKWQFAQSRDPDNPELYDKIGRSYWQLAFDGHRGVDTEALRQAEGYFNSALLLYGSGSFVEQVDTHYRLGKLYIALGDFADAVSHLKIVEAVSELPPIVGWQQLGQAHLGERNFSECEYYLHRVVISGSTLEAEGHKPDEVIGDRQDEREWPLGLVRAWAHLALAFSYVERDGDLDCARANVELARMHAASVRDRDRFPTRIDAACLDCEAFIYQRNRQLADAIPKFKQATGEFPYSRTYLQLARAYMERARRSENRARGDVEPREDLEDAARALTHALCLGPSERTSRELEETMAELHELAAQQH